MRERPLQSSFLKLSLFLMFFGLASASFCQQVVKVVDANDQEPLIGATVIIQEKGFGEITDIDGTVRLTDAIEPQDQIVISYVGYNKQELTYQELQEKGHLILLEAAQTVLDEVVLIYRQVQYKSDILSPLKQISTEEIEALQVQTPADLLEKTSSVFVQKSQMGGGSPVIRGFEANKVLLVIDGIRMNNAIYRSGHLQSSITLDEQVLESVDVIYGPGSIAFGSDALGGVIHYQTKTPKFQTEPTHTGNLLFRYASANTEKTIHGNYQFGSEKLSGYFGFTLSDFGNLRAGGNYPSRYPDFGKRFDYVAGSDMPGTTLSSELLINDDPNVQVGTQYDQQDYFGKIKFRATDQLSFMLNSQVSTSSNIPRYDSLTERDGNGLKFAEWYYGPQDRTLFSLTTNYKSNAKLFDELYFIASHQRIGEERVARNFGSDQREENKEDLSIIGLTLDFNKSIANKYNLVYGFDFQSNQLESTASDNIFTRYPNGENSMNLFGIYSKVGIPLLKSEQYKLNWNNGLRYSVTQINLNYTQDNFFEWPSYFYEGIQNNTKNLSFLSALNYRRKKLNLNLIGGTAFRAPNIDDLAKTRVKIDEITIPNPDLVPEKTLNGELQISVGDENNFLGGSVFLVSLKDAIVRQNFALPDGSTSYINGNDTLLVTANVNDEKAKIYGISTRAGLTKGNFGVNGSISWTKGESTNAAGETSPLGHIPPLFGAITLDYKRSKLTQELNLRFNGKKDIADFGGSVDNPEFATPEGSLAWYTVNYYGNYIPGNRFSIQFGVENILDIHYRTFSSGLSASGRNFIITLKSKI